MALDPKLQKFTTTSPILVSFPSTDIDEGTGIVTYYGASKRIESTDTYLLLKNIIPSDEIAIDSGNHTNASATKLIDLDFDVLFNLPKTINGTVFFSIPLAMSNQTTSASAYVIARVKRGNSTITSVQSRTISAPDVFNRTLLFSVSVTDQYFAAGETLRITIEAWGLNAGGAGWHHVMIGHDPTGRTGWKDSTANAATVFSGTGIYATTPILKVLVPFKIDN